MTMASPFTEVKLTSSHVVNTWFTLTNRVLTYNKVSDTSKLRITYNDSLGARASASNACHWRIVVDGILEASRFSESDVDGSFGWRISNGSHVTWAANLPAGQHVIRIDNMRTPAAMECSSGTNTTGNFLSVEEIP
jgi:hypothetical protein